MRFDLQAGAAPIIAILRGLMPERCKAIADCLYAAGIRIIEVPLNSPQPFNSISVLRNHCANDCLIGAGTVLTTEGVLQTEAAGGQFIVAPNFNTEVVRTALQRGLHAVPGVATATEVFAALQAGTTLLKLFPAVTYGPAHLKALRSVLPTAAEVIAVGGIGAPDVAPWLAAGAAGFGFGSELFRPEWSDAQVEARARALVAACRDAHGRNK